MANIKGTGVPTRKTLGAMGDIYTDTTTGKQYECVFAYRDNQDDDFDCQWKEMLTKVQKNSIYGEMKAEKIPGGGISEKQSDKLEEIKEDEPQEETIEEESAEQERTPTSRNRTNYAAYGKKNK